MFRSLMRIRNHDHGPKGYRRTVLVLGAALFAVLAYADVAGGGVAAAANQSASVTGTTYYVDSAHGDDANTGTSPGSAWQSLTKVNSVVFQPGDRILLASGDVWIGQLLPQGSGTAAAPITIGEYGQGPKPAINADGTTANDGAVVRLYNQQYWVIRDLDLTNYATTGNGRSGVLAIADRSGTLNHIYVEDNDIHDIAAVTDKYTYDETVGLPICQTVNGQQECGTNEGTPNDDIVDGSYSNDGGVVFRAVYGADGSVPSKFNDIAVTGNTIDNVTPFGVGVGVSSEFSVYGYGGASMSNDVPATNIDIAGNSFHDMSSASVNIMTVDGRSGSGVVVQNNVSSDGGAANADYADMWTYDSQGVVIRGNEIYGSQVTTAGADDRSFDLDGYTYNATLEYNYTHDNQGSQFMIYAECNSGDANDIVRYNISKDDNESATKDWILARIWFNTHADQIYGNDFYIGPNEPAGHQVVVLDGGGSTCRGTSSSGRPYDVTLANNIFYVANANWIYGDHGTNDVYSNNLFYGGEPAVTAADTGNITGDPLWAYPGATQDQGRNHAAADFRLDQGSPAIGAGTPIADNGGRDFAGHPVSGPPSIGAEQR